MRLFLCWVCPPMAVLFCGRPFSMVINMVLTLFGWIPGVIHAVSIYSDHRSRSIERAINNPKWTGTQQKRASLWNLADPNFMTWGDVKDAWTGKPMRSFNKPEQTKGSSKKLKEPEPEPINDPRVGAKGTQFKRRGQ